MDNQEITKFASAQRSDLNEVEREKQLVRTQELFLQALEAFPQVVMILDKNRQIVFYNKKLAELTGLKIEDILGKRVGELFCCAHSNETEFGCGTTESCRECGAAKAILASQSGRPEVQECRMTVVKGGASASLDLRVWSVPISFSDEQFTMFTIADISAEKRLEVLERTFFHDTMNEVATLYLCLENLKDNVMQRNDDSLKKAYDITTVIIGDIRQQQELVRAERGQLEVLPEDFSVEALLKDLIKFYSALIQEKRIVLELDCSAEAANIKTDKVLLGRVIGNLIKNAIEATQEGAIKVGCRKQADKHIFYVQNPGVMPQSTQLQIFQRSFTTKGKGRGIGTYSVKFLTENYLKGSVRFSSREGEGTIFYVEL